jgi:hypothetical protein
MRTPILISALLLMLMGCVSPYVGEYKDGQRHGQGTYTWADGTKYVGAWRDNKQHGQGTYTWADGR